MEEDGYGKGPTGDDQEYGSDLEPMPSNLHTLNAAAAATIGQQQAGGSATAAGAVSGHATVGADATSGAAKAFVAPPIWWAADSGQAGCVDVLLEFGADHEVRFSFERLPGAVINQFLFDVAVARFVFVFSTSERKLCLCAPDP